MVLRFGISLLSFGTGLLDRDYEIVHVHVGRLWWVDTSRQSAHSRYHGNQSHGGHHDPLSFS
jgi:hypothetical protein